MVISSPKTYCPLEGEARLVLTATSKLAMPSECPVSRTYPLGGGAGEDVVSTVSIGLDGTWVMMEEEGYREAMTGPIALYNAKGERLHTIYTGAAPEPGKATFFARLSGAGG